VIGAAGSGDGVPPGSGLLKGFAKEFAAVDVKITTINVDQAPRLGDWQHSRGAQRKTAARDAETKRKAFGHTTGREARASSGPHCSAASIEKAPMYEHGERR
jgi:hypothetical protein